MTKIDFLFSSSGDAIEGALKLKHDEFHYLLETEGFQNHLKQAGLTVKDMRRKYALSQISNMLKVFREEIETSHSKCARQFVGQVILDYDVPAPDWYIRALIEADKPNSVQESPDQETQNKQTLEILIRKLKVGALSKIIPEYRKRNFPVKIGNSDDLISEFLKIGRNTVTRDKQAIEEITGKDFFKDETTMVMLIGILKIDLDGLAKALQIEDYPY